MEVQAWNIVSTRIYVWRSYFRKWHENCSNHRLKWFLHCLFNKDKTNYILETWSEIGLMSPNSASFLSQDSPNKDTQTLEKFQFIGKAPKNVVVWPSTWEEVRTLMFWQQLLVFAPPLDCRSYSVPNVSIIFLPFASGNICKLLSPVVQRRGALRHSRTRRGFLDLRPWGTPTI